ncbi:MAG: 12,18-didecarboxysiroheme deacetylase [Lentisphaerae bacterium]|nr:12,18-didecarboxysiroheme deacetylase [Lentisphaerota bacterium]
MIGISKLYCGTVEPSDPLRYGRQTRDLPAHLLQYSSDKKPVVVWNVGRRCNLSCVHCYSQSHNRAYEGELTVEEGFRLIDDLADFGVPVLLFSGGEPLLHPAIFKLIERAVKRKMRAVLSTNGTLITAAVAERLGAAGIAYVGISLDGLAAANDRFRGVQGAYNLALDGIRNCLQRNVKVGLRFTITRRNVHEIGGIFDLVRTEQIPRVCFYHLVYAGRGSALIAEALPHAETRHTVDLILKTTRSLHEQGSSVEVLTVDNHTDGPYLYLRLLAENPKRAAAALELLKMNGGNNSGIGIGCVGWDGAVHPDQFWRHYTLGNVRERPFSRIWSDPGQELLEKLRDRKRFLKGRCAACKWLEICNGNFRVRAEALTGDIWAPEPDCYLSDEEIGLR